MFKFIRKYQKWMLVVFCGGLMVAFIIPQAASQFAPSGEKKVIARIYDGEKIMRGDRTRAINNLALLQQLGFPGTGLYPRENDDADRGMAWLLMVRAGQHAGFTASDSEAFTALSMRQPDIDSTDALDEFATKKNISRAQLLGVVKEYLIAEQYRQLVQGASYQIVEGYSSSPGLIRVRKEAEIQGMVGSQQFQQQLMFDFYGQYGRIPNQNEMQLLTANFIYNQLTGRPRVSDNAVRQSILNDQTQAGGILVAFDSEPSTLAPSEEKLQELFEQYRGDFAGQGETYGFGYRRPGRVRLEALRIPRDRAMALAAEQVTEADVRRYYDDNALLYADWQPRDAEPEEADTPEAEGEGEAAEDNEAGNDESATDPAEGDTTQPDTTDPSAAQDAAGPADDAEPTDGTTETQPEPEPEAEPAPGSRVRIDFRLRREIRQVLILQKASELQSDVVRDVFRILNEDARVLDERDGFKVLPDGFEPTALEEVARRIEEDHGLTLEVINDNGEWVSLPEFSRTMRFTGEMTRWVPTQTVWLPGRGGFMLEPRDLPVVSLSGRLGLLSSGFEQQGQRFSLDQVYRSTKELLEPGPAAIPQQPQVGLVIPAASVDATGSVYVSRLTDAERDRPAESLAEVRDLVVEDAQTLAGYEALLARKDALLQQARDNTIFDLSSEGTEHRLDDFTRSRPPAVEGLSGASTRALVDEAFDLADALREGAGVDGTPSSERLVAVELPGQRKLLVFVLNSYRPMSQSAYEAMVTAPQGDIVTSVALQRVLPANTSPIQSLQETLTLDAMIRHTGLKYAEGEGPSNTGAGDGDDSGE